MGFLLHFFVPHPSNNHRSKMLHHKSLFFLLLGFSLIQAFLLPFRSMHSSILGVATDISVERLLEETNQKRAANGLPTLSLDEELSAAAQSKAADMFARGYWAHNAPDGTTPWVFIKNASYEYSFAGENLAKDFQYSNDVVEAWMASPKHKENLLSKNFEDIGFAVVNGKLNGKETTLVVQMFGRKSTSLARNEAPVRPRNTAPSSDTPLIHGVTQKPLFDVIAVNRSLSVAFLATLVFVFSLELFIIRRRRTVRLVGHNFDHIMFLSGPLLLSAVQTGGSIL